MFGVTEALCHSGAEQNVLVIALDALCNGLPCFPSYKKFLCGPWWQDCSVRTGVVLRHICVIIPWMKNDVVIRDVD